MSDSVTSPVARITLAAAREVIAASELEAERLGAPENIVVVDESGNLVNLVRMDGAKFLAIDIAINKAVTAAGSRKATHELGPVTVPGEPAFGIQAQRGGRFTTIPGGIPLAVDGVPVGAIGVSSASAAEDLQVAKAGLAAFERMLRKQ